MSLEIESFKELKIGDKVKLNPMIYAGSRTYYTKGQMIAEVVKKIANQYINQVLISFEDDSTRYIHSPFELLKYQPNIIEEDGEY